MLKSCPFCGCDAMLKRYSNGFCAIGCSSCINGNLVTYTDELEAIEAWNNRPTENELLEALIELNNILDVNTSWWHSQKHYCKDIISKYKGSE